MARGGRCDGMCSIRYLETRNHIGFVIQREGTKLERFCCEITGYCLVLGKAAIIHQKFL
jgi:hypothetical protein